MKPASFLAPDGAAGSPAFSRPFVRGDLELNLGEHVVDGAFFRLAFVFFELGLKLFFGLVGVEQKFLASTERQAAYVAVGCARRGADEPDDDELAVGHCSSWQGKNSESNSGRIHGLLRLRTWALCATRETPRPAASPPPLKAGFYLKRGLRNGAVWMSRKSANYCSSLTFFFTAASNGEGSSA